MRKKKTLVRTRFRENRNQWEVDYIDNAGQRHRPLFDTEEQAKAFDAKVCKELGQGVMPVAGSAITLKDFAAKRFEVWKTQLCPRTWRSYTTRIKGHILPTLGAVKVAALRVPQCLALLEQKQATLAPGTVRMIRSNFVTLLADAVKAEIITANPIAGLTVRGAHRAKEATGEDDIRPFTRDERDTLLGVAAGSPDKRWVALFSVMARAGLRPSEAYALKIDDLDLAGGTLRVARALNEDRSTKSTKTGERRDVEVSDELAATLTAYLPWRAAQVLQRGWGADCRWLFPSDDGRPLAERHVRKTLARLLKQTKIASHSPVDCRHTFASLLLQAGAPLLYVSKQMGHASSATTLRFYAHYIPEQGQRWVNAPDQGHSGITSRNQKVVSMRKVKQ